MQQEAATINDGEEGKKQMWQKEMAAKSTWESSWKS